MRISDWSSDVCSSDLMLPIVAAQQHKLAPDVERCDLDDVKPTVRGAAARQRADAETETGAAGDPGEQQDQPQNEEQGEQKAKVVRLHGRSSAYDSDRKSDGWGKRVAVRVDIGGRSIIKKKK